LVGRFIRHRSTALLVARVIKNDTKAEDVAAWLGAGAELAPSVARICLEPGAELWAMHFCNSEGIDSWLAALLNDPRGAAFARDVMLAPNFINKVDDFLGLEEAKVFVMRLVREPGVYRFVTWLNRDERMRLWFANIAARETSMQFITEMLLEPGLDKLIVDLLLRKGNDMALRAMLDQWIHTDGSFDKVFGSFATKPNIDRALARVVMSPGFIDGFVIRKFLWQDGLFELSYEALTIVGVQGLKKYVVPLVIGVVVASFALQAADIAALVENMDFDLDAITMLLEEYGARDIVVALLAGLL